MTSRKKYVIKPNFKDEHLFLKELFAAETGETDIKMNNAVYLGQVILASSKKLMRGSTVTTFSLCVEVWPSYAV